MKPGRVPSKTVLTWSLLVAAGAFCLSCNSGTNADVVQPAQITLTVDPNPVPAEPFTPPEPENPDEFDETVQFEFRARFMLTISETAGVGANIDSIFAQVDASSGGIIVTTGDVFQDFTIQSETNRVEGNGSISVMFDVLYALPDMEREALITIEVTAQDDNGFDLEGTLRVPVN